MAKKFYAYHNPNTDSTRTKIIKDPDSDDNSCCNLGCLKFSLYIFSIASLLSGLLITGLSLWILLDGDETISHYSNTYLILAWVALAIGGFVTLSSVVGCCGISRESWILVGFYSVACGILVLLQISGGIVAYIYRAELHQELVLTLNSTIQTDYGMTNTSTAAVDILQSRLHCCGAEGFEDWKTSMWYEVARGNNQVPDSCCKTISRSCGVRDHPSNIYYSGCGHVLAQLGSQHLILLGSVLAGVALLQFFGILLSCQLSRSLKDLDD